MINFEPAGLGFFRKGIAVTAAMFLAMASSAVAQVPSPAPAGPTAVNEQGALVPSTTAAATAERVIVTGSNIPTAEEVGPNPVDTYNRESIDKTGERTTEQFLQSLPTVNANVVPISNNENGSNTAVGAATIALRGFDARATLISLMGGASLPIRRATTPA